MPNGSRNRTKKEDRTCVLSPNEAHVQPAYCSGLKGLAKQAAEVVVGEALLEPAA